MSKVKNTLREDDEDKSPDRLMAALNLIDVPLSEEGDKHRNTMDDLDADYESVNKDMADPTPSVTSSIYSDSGDEEWVNLNRTLDQPAITKSTPFIYHPPLKPFPPGLESASEKLTRHSKVASNVAKTYFNKAQTVYRAAVPIVQAAAKATIPVATAIKDHWPEKLTYVKTLASDQFSNPWPANTGVDRTRKGAEQLRLYPGVAVASPLGANIAASVLVLPGTAAEADPRLAIPQWMSLIQFKHVSLFDEYVVSNMTATAVVVIDYPGDEITPELTVEFPVDKQLFSVLRAAKQDVRSAEKVVQGTLGEKLRAYLCLDKAGRERRREKLDAAAKARGKWLGR